ncbi:ABC transporter substrate-binding protein [Tessaracoccus palaemonis]|uniref:ABC transporter substrate-binding protein n=1 Tax=Tessaracoccus palaemonis TaxID=2829499 RepID=A0ABX8SKU3_9ACTN|nr:ABC transporter substrate-binding protein [Tessaracoccus palaemonis]QXT63579.1 ABC transporter substrate-binding protein [Tessaracoccus palaemonis]
MKRASTLARALTALAAAASLALAACGSGSSDSTADATAADKTLNFVTVYPANTTDAHQVQASFILNSGAVETLVGFDPDTLELYPWLAESWDTDDAQHWTFHLREGVEFHNGEPMTAEKVMASLQDSIDVNPGVAAALTIDSMEVVDEHTLSITTADVYPALISNLVHFNAVITDVDAEGDLPVGTGAFKFDSFDIAGEAVLSRNDSYWDGTAKLDKVVMTANEDSNARVMALQSGDADIIYRPGLESLPTLEADESLTVDTVSGTRVYHLLYNYSGANADLWNNEEFRRGIDALVDRQSIVDTVMGGQATVAYNVFPGDWPFSPETTEHEFGVEAALQHFEAAGLDVADGKVTRDGQPLSLKMATYVARAELPQIAQIVQDQARQVGIDMEIYVAENIDEYLPQGDWDLVTYSLLTISRGDGAFFLNSAFGADAAQNHGRLDDPTLQSMLDAFNKEVDVDSRTEQTREIAEYIDAEAYNSYITVPNESAAFKDTVTGWKTPANEFEFQMITKDLDIN